MKKVSKILTIMLSLTLVSINTGCYTKEYNYTTLEDRAVNSSKLSEPMVDVSTDNQIMKLVKRGYSNYGYIQLDSTMQEGYKLIETALLNVEEKVSVTEEVFANLSVLLMHIASDNPLYFWEPKLKYTPNVGGGYNLSFEYAFSKEVILNKLIEIDSIATEYCETIPSGLSNFDKALLVHDRLVSDIEYDKTLLDPWRHEVYGGFVNNYATCLGYSKTYQYLMCRLSVDTLIAYGYAEDEQHAWNIINLDGEYYHVDTTFNTGLRNSEFLKGYTQNQHVFTFLNDEEIEKTHTDTSVEFNSYELPVCSSTQKNYYRMKDLMVSSKSMDTVNSDIDEALSNAISVALADKNSILEIRFEDEEIGKEVIRTIENGELDSRVKMLSKLRGIGNVESRSYTAKNGVLTYYFS